MQLRFAQAEVHGGPRKKFMGGIFHLGIGAARMHGMDEARGKVAEPRWVAKFQIEPMGLQVAAVAHPLGKGVFLRGGVERAGHVSLKAAVILRMMRRM